MESRDIGPQGELATRTLAMPADANPHGDIFGGWVLSQMDIAGGIAAARRARGRVATVAVDAVMFVGAAVWVGMAVTVGAVMFVGVAVWAGSGTSVLTMRVTVIGSTIAQAVSKMMMSNKAQMKNFFKMFTPVSLFAIFMGDCSGNIFIIKNGDT